MTSELELSYARLDRLQRISRELNGAANEVDVTRIVMTLLDAPISASTRGLWLHEAGSDRLSMVASSGFHPSTVDRFHFLDLDAELPGSVAYNERRTVMSTSRAKAEQEYEALRGTERSAEGFVAVPLILEDLCLGVLGLGYSTELAAQDVVFLEAVGGLVAQSLVRVRLAERDLRRREELEFLADLTEAALSAEGYEELMQKVTAAAVPMLGDWCSLYFLPEYGGSPHIAIAHVDSDKVSWVNELQQRYPYNPNGVHGVASVIRSGETEFIPDVSEELIEEAVAQSALDPEELRSILATFSLTSVITVPLLTKRRVVGAMQFMSAESGRHYFDNDVALAEAVAGRLAEALDSAWMNDQHRNIAVTLQTALLPPRLPAIPGIDLAARYWPAGGSQVGGDFYDVFEVPDGWSIVIGDSCGTGPNAAALTSIARHTIRAAARHGAGHADVMDWLNEAILRSDRDLFCTACYSTLSRSEDGWLLRSAAGGHPLPIVSSRRTGTAMIGHHGTLLGMFESVKVSTCETTLGSGDVVVYYTDGVTDLAPPADLIATEMLDLVESLRDLGSAGAIADAMHQSVIERVPDRSRQDDIAVVIVRVKD